MSIRFYKVAQAAGHQPHRLYARRHSDTPDTDVRVKHVPIYAGVWIDDGKYRPHTGAKERRKRAQ